MESAAVAVNDQPTSLSSMNTNADFYRDYHLIDEKQAFDADYRQHQCQHRAHGAELNNPNYRCCRYHHLRRWLLPATLGFCLALVAFLAYMYYTCNMSLASGEGLLKRATDVVGSNTNGQSSFTSQKLYLIVVFVGLLLVVILGIMLSAWCCRGAFENPLCCPCYLCACCGGLACLECIACGLCAEGLEQA